MRVAVFFSALVIAASFAGEAAAYTTTTTMVYNGTTYNLNSTSTCPDGSSALRYKRKWWCPVTSTSTGSTTPTPTPAPAPTSYNAQVSWTIPTTRADGTPLSVSELKGYEVYYTNSTGSISQVLPISGGSTASTTVSSLSSGSYSFSVSAIDTSGLKSSLSSVVAISYP